MLCTALSTVKGEDAERCACDINSLMRKKNAAAVQLGRRGGKATAKNLTADERRAIAKKAAKARWARKASA
jgi:hypothetical protein